METDCICCWAAELHWQLAFCSGDSLYFMDVCCVGDSNARNRSREWQDVRGTHRGRVLETFWDQLFAAIPNWLVVI